MKWNLLSRAELLHINEKVMAEEGEVSAVLKEDALAEAVESPAFDYAETLADAVYVLAVAISQRHPFENGNKRTASKAVKKFLKRNGRIPTEGQMEGIADLIGGLADDDPMEKEDFITELEHILSLGAEA